MRPWECGGSEVSRNSVDLQEVLQDLERTMRIKNKAVRNAVGFKTCEEGERKI